MASYSERLRAVIFEADKAERSREQRRAQRKNTKVVHKWFYPKDLLKKSIWAALIVLAGFAIYYIAFVMLLKYHVNF